MINHYSESLNLMKGSDTSLGEFDRLPVVPHLPQTYEFFDDDETIPSLEQKYQMDLSGFILKNTADVPGGLVEYHEPLE